MTDLSDLQDPATLLRRLIAAPSVTPDDAGALDALKAMLTPLGFACTDLPFGGEGRPVIQNLYARSAGEGRCLAFAGHTDVVPPGDVDAWTSGPFTGEIHDGVLFGRGAVDMKGAIACFTAALARIHAETGTLPGPVAYIVTGDEEGPAVDGTARMVAWLRERRERIDHCLLGEPTNPTTLGEMIKIGRRGSFSATITVHGRQGHVAYPHNADNPIPYLVEILSRLSAWHLDDGTAHFGPSSLQITTVDVGNPATNVIPSRASARFNIRFNDSHDFDSLRKTVQQVCSEVAGERARIETIDSAMAFVTEPGPFTELVSNAVVAETGRTPDLSTTGGTSDARFLKDLCPVVEFGLAGATMHQVDERVPLADLEALTRIYQRVISDYFDADL